MGFLNQSFAQIRELFGSMTPAARITAALLVAVIGVSLAYLFQGYGVGADEYLFGGEFLQRGEADRVEAAFATAGLGAYVREGGRIRVPKGQKAAYLAAVADSGALPANFDTVMDESLDLGPFVSGEERKQRSKAARERQLSMIVGMMNGIEHANVLFDVREARGFGKEKVTATVSVQPAAGESIDAHRIRMIQGAVAGAIAGLVPTDVKVLNLADGSAYDQSGNFAADEFDEPYFRAKIAYEQRMQHNIEEFLRDIPNVRIQVTAELDDTLLAHSRTTKASGDPAELRSTVQEEITKTTQYEDRGRPGLQAQGPTRAGAEEQVAKNESSVENKNRDTDNFIPFAEEQLQRAGLVPQHVRAAIAIPSEYITRVWKERNPDGDPTASDLTNVETEVKGQITDTVTQLFPKETGENPFPNVKVTVFQSLTPAPVAPPSQMATGLAWASRNSGTLIMSGLAVVALMMLRSMVKSIPPGETNITLAPRLAAGTAPAEGAARAAAGAGGASGAATDPGSVAAAERERVRVKENRPRLKLKKGGSIKDDLTDLVRDDPDSAAAILKSWIGSAG